MCVQKSESARWREWCNVYGAMAKHVSAAAAAIHGCLSAVHVPGPDVYAIPTVHGAPATNDAAAATTTAEFTSICETASGEELKFCLVTQAFA